MRRFIRASIVLTVLGLLSTHPVSADSIVAATTPAYKDNVRKLSGFGSPSGSQLDAIHQTFLDSIEFLSDSGVIGTLTDGNIYIGSALNAPAAKTVSGDISMTREGVVSFSQTATIGADPSGAANDVIFSTTGIIFEGASADTSEGLLTAADPSADQTWTLPNDTGTIVVSSALTAGTCTLDGASPSVCTDTVTAATICVCANVGATAVIAANGCAVGLSGTTLTITGADGATHDVNWHCF